jgi:peptidoglycan/xylan/chitin deacetylase (PgdA/CDA1 family)
MLLTCFLLALSTHGGDLPAIRAGLPSESVVLTYHDMVETRDANALWFDCTPQELTEQLDWMLAQGASFISAKQLEAHLAKGDPLPKKAVLITFADNYLGFYRLAWPILRGRKVPVVQFVHTDFVGNRQGRPKMSWEQLRELDRSGLVTIASQTRSHPADLTTSPDARLVDELSGSKATLEERLGHPIRYLAYPNGKYDARTATFAASARYRMAFTEAQVPAERSPSIFMVARTVHTRYRQAFQALKGPN